jgi:methionyl-tRNA formyltransferase
MSQPTIALLASGNVGVKIAEYLAQPHVPGKITRLYLSGQDESLDAQISTAAGVDGEFVFVGKEVFHDRHHIQELNNEELDVLISVYWPWILSPEYFQKFSKTINFHPALLPANRGWYPHVFNLMEETPAGVTLHEIAEDADSGGIWAQGKVPVSPFDTAFDLYGRLQNEMFVLFQESWDGISRGTIKPVPQDHSLATYNKKSSIGSMDEIDLNNSANRALLNKLRARSFGDLGFAYFTDEDTGQKIYLKLQLNDSQKFSQE